MIWKFFNKFFSVTATIIITFNSTISAQEYTIYNITTQDGLTNPCIQDILQDSQGFIWFATEGGLSRYDGYNFKLYDCGEKFIRTIFEDPADSGKFLWIGTEGGGLFQLNQVTEKFKQYQRNDNDPYSISSNIVRDICKSKDGIYWLATGWGLNEFNPVTGKFISYKNNPNDPSSINSDIVFTVYEDHLGNIWVGTYLGGLDKFDRKNKKFIHYKYDPDVPLLSTSSTVHSNRIFSILEDRNKNLWIGTWWALFRYDRQSNLFFRQDFKKNNKPVINNALIFKIIEDNEKSLWLATNQGLVRISSDRKDFRYFTDEINSTVVSSVYVDKSGIIWIGTFCEGIKKIIPRKKFFYHYGHSGNERLRWTYSFEQRDRNEFWIGTESGLYKFKDNKITQYPVIVDSFVQGVSRIVKSKSGKLWLANSGCLIDFDSRTNKLTGYFGKYLTYSSSMNDLIKSQFKNSTEIAGIKKVKNNQELTKEFIIKEKTDVIVLSTGEWDMTGMVDYGWITEAGNNKNIWEITLKNSRYAGGSFKNRQQVSLLTLYPGRYQLHYKSDNKHAYGNWVNTKPDLDIWGIHVYRINSYLFGKLKNIKSDDYTYLHDLESIVEDDNGKVWVTFTLEDNTVHAFDQKQKQFLPYYITIDSMLYSNIETIIKEKSGRLWFKSFNNILIRKDFDDKCEIKFNLNDFAKREGKKINQLAINQVYEDNRENLWIGSDIGLFRYNLSTEKIDHYKFKDLMLPNTIHAIIEDNRGELWITTSGSLFKFNPVSGSLRKYDEHDGLPNIKFSGSSSIKLADGLIAFGGSDGFIVFQPDSITDNETIPIVVFTDLKIFNKSIPVGDSSKLKKTINESEKLILNYQDVFTFEFASLEFTDPAKNSYAYKMEGVDPDWVFTDASQRFANYTTLSPGKYIFTVKGSNNDGTWNQQGKSILIIITPPWWRTVWAYLMYMLLLTGIIYATWRMQLRRIRLKHEYEMSRFEAEKLYEVDEMKTRFFTNISHEFRTPLTLILGPAKDIIDKSEDMEAKQNAGLIKRNADKLYSLVNQLLDLSRLESGKMKLQTSEQDVIPVVKGVFLSFSSLAEKRKILLKLNTDFESVNVYVDNEKLEKILNNLLSNSFKFTPEGGQVTVNLTKDDNYFILSIRDTGVGIPPEQILKIFDRFYQVDGSHTRAQEGTGIGLALTKELVELHKGKIIVESKEGIGTTFTISLPLGKDHLNPEEIIEHEVEEISEVIYKKADLISEGKQMKEKTDIDTFLEADKPLLLVVEDNTDVRKYIINHLDNDYRILEAVDGEDGLEQSQNHIPDLVISDVMMPKMDGFTLCSRLKNDEKTSHIPVIMLTAKAASQDKIEGYETGADDYIMKPFEAAELKVRIKNLIETRRRLQEKFSSDDFRIPKELNPVDEQFVKRLLNVINAHISEEEFSIEELGKESGMSRGQVYKKIKAMTGKSPSLFLRSVRLSQARKMLKNHNSTIAEIAYSVGFSSPAYFTKCFNEEFGYNPSEIIKS